MLADKPADELPNAVENKKHRGNRRNARFRKDISRVQFGNDRWKIQTADIGEK